MADVHRTLHRMEFYMATVGRIPEIKMDFMVAVVLIKHLPEKINVFFTKILYIHDHRKTFCKPVERFFQLYHIHKIHKNSPVFGHGKCIYYDHKPHNYLV